MADRTITVRLKAAIAGYQSDMERAKRSTKDFGDSTNQALGNVGPKMENVGRTMTRTVTPAAAAMAGAFKLAANDWNAGSNAIRAGTGATGDALKELEGSMKSVAGQTTASFGQVGEVIADLNTRTGATGETLERLAKQLLDLERLGNQASVESVTRVFGDWGVQVERQADALDDLFRVSQLTGPSIDRLGQMMVRYGAPMRQLGFDFEEAALMLGKFEQEGVNTELVMGSLRIALGQMARSGEPAIETFQRVVAEIENAGDASEANRIALELFGARAGPDMAAAIREGRFSLDELRESFAANEDTISKAAEETLTLNDRFRMLMNRATGVVGPVGDVGFVLAGIAAGAGPAITSVGKLTTALGSRGMSGSLVTFARVAVPAAVAALALQRGLQVMGDSAAWAREQLAKDMGTDQPRTLNDLIEQTNTLIGRYNELQDIASQGDSAGPGPLRFFGMGAVRRQIEGFGGMLGLVDTPILDASAATHEYADAIKDLMSGIDNWRSNTRRLMGDLDMTQDEVEALARAAGIDLAGAAEKVIPAMEQAASGTGAYGDAASGAVGPTGDLGDAADDAAENFSDLEQAVRDAQDALNSMLDPAARFLAAQDRVTHAQQAHKEAVTEGGEQSIPAKRAAFDLAQALLGQERAARDVIDAYRETGRTSDDLIGDMRRLRTDGHLTEQQFQAIRDVILGIDSDADRLHGRRIRVEAELQFATNLWKVQEELDRLGVDLPAGMFVLPEDVAGPVLPMPTAPAPSSGGTGHTVPHRQHGGNVWPGQVFRVGESGAELLTFGSQGRVLSHQDSMHLAGGSAPQVTIDYDRLAAALVSSPQVQQHNTFEGVPVPVALELANRNLAETLALTGARP